MANTALVLPRQDSTFLKQLPKKWQHKALHLRSEQEVAFATPSYLLHLRREKGWGYTVSYEPLPSGLQWAAKRALTGPQRPFITLGLALTLLTLARMAAGLAAVQVPTEAFALALCSAFILWVLHYLPSSSDKFYDNYLKDPAEVKALSGRALPAEEQDYTLEDQYLLEELALGKEAPCLKDFAASQESTKASRTLMKIAFRVLALGEELKLPETPAAVEGVLQQAFTEDYDALKELSRLESRLRALRNKRKQLQEEADRPVVEARRAEAEQRALEAKLTAEARRKQAQAAVAALEAVVATETQATSEAREALEA